MKNRLLIALVLSLGVRYVHAQASPYNNFLFKAQVFTAPSQTGAPIALNGLNGGSTVGSSYTAGTITVTGTALSTATFAVVASADNGVNYFPILISPQQDPSSTSQTITVTGPGLYQINLAGFTHVKFSTMGTFSASSLSIQLTATPNGLSPQGFASSGGGPGAGVSSFNTRTGPVVSAVNDYSFALLSGAPSTAQIAAVGDLSNNTTGNASNALGIGGAAISGAFSALYVPVATDSTHIVPRRLTADDIAPGFTINSFTGGSTVEIGATVTNPAFTATYSATPVSANITNTDGINSPFTLTTPFTSGTVTGAFTKTAATSTTFTLNATGSVTKTATSAIVWAPRTFSGVGTAGATGATASGTTAVLTGATGTLVSGGLNNQTTYAASPSSQKVYILMIGGSHTFKDVATGFSFAFNTPTSISFVNANGSTVTMFLYESTNTLSGTFSIQVAS